jgi:hypothetical protein
MAEVTPVAVDFLARLQVEYCTQQTEKLNSHRCDFEAHDPDRWARAAQPRIYFNNCHNGGPK